MNEFTKKKINPSNLQDFIEVDNLSQSNLDILYKKLKTIREVEKKIAKEREAGNIGGPVHLSIGQEAIPAGISMGLERNDYIFGAHRSHAHILALGSPIRKLFAELLGKKTGLSKGLGGSMHLIDESVGFKGSVPIVAGTISLAVGASMAISLKGTKNIAISFLGDGASEEGAFHESLNLAKVHNLPVIFVVENNLFSSHMDISLRQPNPFISRFAKANHIPYKLIDGNNVVEVVKESKKLIENCRESKGPAFIEAITYRWMGHVDWRDDIDVGINRCKETLKAWKEKCPLKRMTDSLISSKKFSSIDLSAIDEEINKEINKCWDNALKDDYPEKASLLKNVYF